MAFSGFAAALIKITLASFTLASLLLALAHSHTAQHWRIPRSMTGLSSANEQRLTDSSATAPSWFLDHTTCASLQETYHKFYTSTGRNTGEIMRNEDTPASSDAPAQIWQATPPALQELLLQPEALVQRLMSDELPNQHILFIGDSTTFQQIRSLRCLLEAAAFKQESMGISPDRWRRGEQSLLLSFIFATSFEEVFRHLADREPSQSLRVVIGLGAWYNSDRQTAWAGELEQFVGSVKSIEHRLGASIYLREPLPQHFEYSDQPISDGAFRTPLEIAANFSAKPTRCAPVRDSKDWRSRVFDDKTADLPGKVLLRDMAVPMYYGHGSGHIHTGLADCTHYAAPAMHVFNAALAQQVGRRHGWQSWRRLFSIFKSTLHPFLELQP
mmetsp:Transcript_44524/g.80000  ORF Transcript_44524/g.80000 Transcript_44524/m.80000 type:complete len:385 (+) Transcript_44524:85-1239(+)